MMSRNGLPRCKFTRGSAYHSRKTKLMGILLLSLSESDLESHLMVESRVVRRKMLQHLKGILEKENQGKDNWYMKLRKIKTKGDSVYLIYDPTDMKFTDRLKKELVKKSVQVRILRFILHDIASFSWQQTSSPNISYTNSLIF